MALSWDGTIFDAQAPTNTPQYNVLTIPAGATLERTLLWVEALTDYTSDDPLAGTGCMFGLVVGPSAVAPPITPYTNWADPTTGTWLWTWACRFKHDTVVPWTAPTNYVTRGDLNDKMFDIRDQRKNTTAGNLYLWFVGEVNPGVGVTVLTTSTYVRGFLKS